MAGTDRVRFCGQCNLNVYNLSELSKQEAEEFISSNEGRLCIRFYRRPDGSILTRNCPVGLRAIRRKLSRVAQAAIATVLSFLAGLGFYRVTTDAFAPQQHDMGTLVRPPLVMGKIAINVPLSEPEVKTMEIGKVAIETPKPYHPRSRRKFGQASYR